MYFAVDGTNVRLAGSIHKFPNPDPVPPWLLDAYNWCEGWLCECDLPDVSIAPYFELPPTDSLDLHLSPDVLADVRAMWPATAAPLLSRKPWTVMFALPMFLTGTLSPGVEDQLIPLGRANRKAPNFLETIADIASLLDPLPDSVFELAIKTALIDRTLVARSLNDMYSAWIVGDIPAMMEISSRTGFLRFPQLSSVMVDTRNKAWLPRIIQACECERHTLIVVGGLHLGGKGSIIDLLAERGYSTTRIS